MRHAHSSHDHLREAFAAFILGTGATRVKLSLTLDERDLTEEFIRSLGLHGFAGTTVGNIDIEPEQRVPAFLIQERTAYFGWVFWEKFTDTRMRKLWGSVLRNEKGDWAIQISSSQPTTIYANAHLMREIDIDRPT